jgi:CRISPR/Cas system-associated protein Cas5 (RAMP superfamily)
MIDENLSKIKYKLMIINFSNTVIFSTYDEKIKMKEKIIDFISESKMNKILYKGDPNGVDYKLLKKILSPTHIFDDNTTNIKNFVNIEDDDNIRDIYKKFLDKINCEYCVIYKK